jgi:spore germination protein GerM
MLEFLAGLRRHAQQHAPGTTQTRAEEHQGTMGISDPGNGKTPAGRRSRSAALLWLLPAAIVLSGCVATSQPSGSTAAGSPQVMSGTANGEAPSSSAPLETTQASNKAPVYWIGRSNDNTFLYREFRDVPEQENPVTRALRAMMSQKPLDPDFFTPWQNPKKLATSISGKNVITVDVSPDAFNSNLDAGMAERAIQQLVYTATAAGASSGLVDSTQQIQVVILVDGHTDYLAFNHVRLGSPMSRSQGMVAPVWIIDPQEGVGVADGSVKVSGRSIVPGSKLRWKILRVEGTTDKSSYLGGEVTASAESAQQGLFSLAVNLAPGNYEVRVSQIDPGHSDVELNVDTRGFSVK